MAVRAELAFSVSDLAQMRFAVAPMWEVGPSYRLLACGSSSASCLSRYGTTIRATYTSTGTVMLVSLPNVSTTFTHAVYLPALGYL